VTQLTKLFSTTAFRLSMATVAVVAVIAVLLGWYVFPKTTDLMTRQVMETISAEADGLREQFDAGGMRRLQASIAARIRPGGTSLYYLKGPRGKKRAGNLNRMPPELLSPARAGTFIYARRSASGSRAPGQSRSTEESRHTEERLAAGVIIAVPGGSQLVVARDIDDQRQLAELVKWTIYGGFAALVVVGLGGGLLVSRQTLRRIDEVTRASQRIMAGDLAGRIPLSGSDDELDRLSHSLNAMLERIEQLMSGLREVSDNIAHDLKTPLNRLRNRAEAALRDAGNVSAYRTALEATIDEADGLMKTFNALLSIARLEAGALDDDMVPIDLGAVLHDVGELYEPLAEEAGFALNVAVAEHIWITANRQLIGQMVANLIDNAVKYSAESLPSAGSAAPLRPRDIKLSLRQLGSSAQIIVADHGPGIEAADRQRALQRFVRLEASRSRPGSGLGLSLVTAVVRLHGGSICLEDNHPGLRVVILFPDICDRLVSPDMAGGPVRGPVGAMTGEREAGYAKTAVSGDKGAVALHCPTGPANDPACAETAIHARRTS